MGVIGRKPAVLAFRLRRGTTAGRSPIARRAERRRDTEALIHDLGTRKGTKKKKMVRLRFSRQFNWRHRPSKVVLESRDFFLDTRARNGKFVRSGKGN